MAFAPTQKGHELQRNLLIEYPMVTGNGFGTGKAGRRN